MKHFKKPCSRGLPGKLLYPAPAAIALQAPRHRVEGCLRSGLETTLTGVTCVRSSGFEPSEISDQKPAGWQTTAEVVAVEVEEVVVVK